MKRVLLKLSGEALAGDKKTGFDEEKTSNPVILLEVIIWPLLRGFQRHTWYAYHRRHTIFLYQEI